MTYLLDSNILIEHLAGRLDLTARVRAVGLERCRIPTISVYEVLHGALRSSRPAEYERTRSLLIGFNWANFDELAARVAAHLRSDLESKGMIIGPHDLLIAAIAVAHGLTLVTP